MIQLSGNLNIFLDGEYDLTADDSSCDLKSRRGPFRPPALR